MKTAKETKRILFIGNSFTARNDLPELIAQLATASGKVIEHRLVSAGAKIAGLTASDRSQLEKAAWQTCG